jgi:hypothetical protein
MAGGAETIVQDDRSAPKPTTPVSPTPRPSVCVSVIRNEPPPVVAAMRSQLVNSQSS